ncbi:tyrosine-type recombinase/integrase [Acidimangrovimonas sediminis]|uniref:tyrosine-type recombinase/integrase n=1 Tax=Acidimangrovimonas sediminis TaxID=2056283 RepID=UPI001304E2F4|nr:tyrosine-type recombinase/integrase [Acidimangrovimonas sediminis]
MVKPDIQGVHRVRKRLSDGTIRHYHYAFRGGPCFWNSAMSFAPPQPEYFLAYNDAIRGASPRGVSTNRDSTAAVMTRYRKSPHFTQLKPRTRQDYKKYLDSFGEEFGNEPIKIFEEPESLDEIGEWKNQWAHSPRQFDYATSVVTRFLNWTKANVAALSIHHHFDVERLYRSDRSDIIWLPDEQRALLDVACEREKRVVVAASEGGLTPQDIGILTREHVQNTRLGRRLYFRRTKTTKPVSIPVTPALGRLIDETPEDQEYLVVSLTGRRLTPERASQIVRDLKERVNTMAEGNPAMIRVRDELRLYDMRGTAATELLRAGCSLNEIAVTMGWGLRHAANIIEKYAALVPEVADEVLAKLTAARERAEVERKT